MASGAGSLGTPSSAAALLVRLLSEQGDSPLLSAKGASCVHRACCFLEQAARLHLSCAFAERAALLD